MGPKSRSRQLDSQTAERTVRQSDSQTLSDCLPGGSDCLPAGSAAPPLVAWKLSQSCRSYGCRRGLNYYPQIRFHMFKRAVISYTLNISTTKGYWQ